MAGELKAALTQVRTVAAGVAGIRAVHPAEPTAINHAPETYIARVKSLGGALTIAGLSTATLGNSSWIDQHEVTLRTVLSRADADSSEAAAFDLLDLLAAAFRADHTLSGTVTDCEVSDYDLGYLDVGSSLPTRYRALDVTLRLRIDKYE